MDTLGLSAGGTSRAPQEANALWLLGGGRDPNPGSDLSLPTTPALWLSEGPLILTPSPEKLTNTNPGFTNKNRVTGSLLCWPLCFRLQPVLIPE